MISPGDLSPADGARRAAAVLHRVFGYESFRGQQEEIISHAVSYTHLTLPTTERV